MIENYDNASVVQCFQTVVEFLSRYENPTEDDEYNDVHPKTVLCWYLSFNNNDSDNGCFVNCRKLSNRKTLLPMPFNNNPDVKDAFISYCYKNLSTLTAKMLHEYMLINLSVCQCY